MVVMKTTHLMAALFLDACQVAEGQIVPYILGSQGQIFLVIAHKSSRSQLRIQKYDMVCSDVETA